MDAEHYIALGKMEATVKALTNDVADIKSDQKSHMIEVKETLAGQDEKLDKLLALHHQRRGAIRLGKGIIALVTSSGFAGWIWEHLHK